jgi:hypothetical protein
LVIRDGQLVFQNFKHSDGPDLSLYLYDREPKTGKENSPEEFTSARNGGDSVFPLRVPAGDSVPNIPLASFSFLNDPKQTKTQDLYLVLWCTQFGVLFGSMRFTPGWNWGLNIPG